MSQNEEGRAKVDASLLPITIEGVVLSPKERTVKWTPWPVLSAVRLCFSLLIQLAAVPFWIVAALLHLPNAAFLVFLFVGVGYGGAYWALSQTARRLSKAPLEGQRVDWFIDAGGVRRVSSLFDIRIDPEGFASVTEDKSRFLFFTSSQICVVLPKRCVSADRMDALRVLLSTWPQTQLRLP